MQYGAGLCRAVVLDVVLIYLDDLKESRAVDAKISGTPFKYIIDPPYRWATSSKDDDIVDSDDRPAQRVASR